MLQNFLLQTVYKLCIHSN